MKVKGLDGKTYTWSLAKYTGKERVDCSSGHERTREFLHQRYPALQVLEEVYLPSEQLYIDFFIPVLKIAVEFQGAQHAEYCIHFFSTKMDFYRAQARDNRKAEFCRINGITLIYFYESDKEEEWRVKLSI